MITFITYFVKIFSFYLLFRPHKHFLFGPHKVGKNMDEAHHFREWEGYVDWKNRPALRGQHGGMLAASFVLAVEVLENLAYLATASNLVLYLLRIMHFSPSSSANIVTNFMGTAFVLALLGGFLSDAYFTTYCIYLISALIEFMGLLILTLQARIPSLRPPSCMSMNRNIICQEAEGAKSVMLFSGLYLVALGVGGIKGSLLTHGAEQFDDTVLEGRKKRSTFFNYYVFCLSCGALIAVTFVVWIEDNRGWQWGFGISTATILISILIFLIGSGTYRNRVPRGSPVTAILKVLTAAVYNTCICKTPCNTTASEDDRQHANQQEAAPFPTETDFLNRAVHDRPDYQALECTVKEVEDVKIVLRILPIFMSTIMLNCCLAQLSTFSVQQAATMNNKIGSLRVPPASLPVFPVLFIMVLAPMYNHVIIPFARKLTKTEMGITHLQRIGTGLILSIVAMTVAAQVEVKRKKVATQYGQLNSNKPLPITFLWVSLQYLFLGSADLFTLAGMMEFFFTEAPVSLRSLATSLSWASLAMGYYFSSVLVTTVNRITSTFGHTPWLYGTNINYYHLERFYWLMGVLSGLNFLHFLFWANRYKYRSTRSENE